MHLQVVEGSDKLFLCILCQLISWLHPNNQIIVLVQFWHIAYCCWDISAGLILVKVTLLCCLTDTHGYSISCTSMFCYVHRICTNIRYLFKGFGRFCVAAGSKQDHIYAKIAISLAWSASSKPRTPVKCKMNGHTTSSHS